ncbi:MAG: hypothetical protein PVF58_20420 [Candidatus Methanofastidiosia archaeon]|jgi:hypothetical protein
MDEKEAIQFLKEFRDTIDEYLFLGYSPANNPFAKDYKQMQNALKDPEFQYLRETIMNMEPKALDILEECGLPRYSMGNIPMTRVDIKFTAFELVWRNYSFGKVDKKVFFDIIDRTISILEGRLAHGILTVVSLQFAEDIGKAVDQIAHDKELTVQVLTPGTDIFKEINQSEFFIIDLSQTDNDLWFCAGYVQGSGENPIFIAKNGTVVKSILVDMEYPVIYFEDEYDLWRKVSERIHILRRNKEKGK